MVYIACLCGNDVRENNVKTAHTFVSREQIREYYEAAPFFGLPYDAGDKAEI